MCVLASQTKHVTAAYSASQGTKFAASLDILFKLPKKAKVFVCSSHQLLDKMKWCA